MGAETYTVHYLTNCETSVCKGAMTALSLASSTEVFFSGNVGTTKIGKAFHHFHFLFSIFHFTVPLHPTEFCCWNYWQALQVLPLGWCGRPGIQEKGKFQISRFLDVVNASSQNVHEKFYFHWTQSDHLLACHSLTDHLLACHSLTDNVVDVWLRFWSWCLVEILQMKFDQHLCLNLWYELNSCVRCAFGNATMQNLDWQEDAWALTGYQHATTQTISGGARKMVCK